MKVTIVILTLSLLSGCGWVSRLSAHYIGHDKVCVDGVTYIQFTSGAVAQIDRNGKPVECRQ